MQNSTKPLLEKSGGENNVGPQPRLPMCWCDAVQSFRGACSSSQSDVCRSLQPVIDRLNSILRRLELKGEAFDIYDAADNKKIEVFWDTLQQVDETLSSSDTTKAVFKGKTDLLTTAVKFHIICSR